MNLKVKKIMISILLSLVMTFSHNIAAESASKAITKQQAISVAKENFGGKVLSIKWVNKPKASFYKVKLLSKEGRVKQLRVDSRTGEILNSRASD